MDIKAIDNLLGQLRAASAAAGAPVGGAAAAGAAAAGGIPDFATLLKSSLEAANNTQVDAAHLARDFESGAAGSNLTDVMVSMQKANISFQEMVQVRNRLVSAYHDIMYMQV